MVPGASEATGPTARATCPITREGTHRITRTPAAAAISPGVFLIVPRLPPRAEPSALLAGGNTKVDVARDRLAREFVRHLDLEAIVASRKRGQLHALARRQLMAQGHVEFFRQRAGVERLHAIGRAHV